MTREGFRIIITERAEEYVKECGFDDSALEEAIEIRKGDYINGALDAFDILNK